MIFLPAIDLKEGKCVRLLRGDMDKATVFGDDPGAQAKSFAASGAEWIHVVDLDGAFAGKPANRGAVEAIVASVGATPVQLGGGIRNMETVASWLEHGVSRVILGTAALTDPGFVKEAAREFPGRVAVGIDAKDGMVATEGWAEVSDMPALDLARRFEDAGVAAIIHTDISRDGAMQGPNWQASLEMAIAVAVPVIVSGGVSSLADLEELVEKCGSRIGGVISGRALYDGAFTVEQALEVLHGSGFGASVL